MVPPSYLQPKIFKKCPPNFLLPYSSLKSCAFDLNFVLYQHNYFCHVHRFSAPLSPASISRSIHHVATTTKFLAPMMLHGLRSHRLHPSGVRSSMLFLLSVVCCFTCSSLVLFVVLRRRPDKTEQPICAKVGLAKVGQDHDWPKSVEKLAKVGLAKVGHDRRNWPKSKLAEVDRARFFLHQTSDAATASSSRVVS